MFFLSVPFIAVACSLSISKAKTWQYIDITTLSFGSMSNDWLIWLQFNWPPQYIWNIVA
jgi:hypothetical protein